MPRRVVFSKDDIWRRRALFWEAHYQRRGVVREMALDDARVLAVLVAYVPAPEMAVDGSQVRTMAVLKGEVEALKALRLSRLQSEFMCLWYWSESNWMAFVREFQSLPDVQEDYYLQYDEGADVGRLVPMSSKVKRVVPVPVDNCGGSQVQVARIRYKSAESGG